MDSRQASITADDLLAVIDAAGEAAARASRDQADLSVLQGVTAEETLNASLLLRRLTRKWIRDGVKVIAAAEELQRRRQLLGVARGAHEGAAGRLDQARERCAAASRQLADVDSGGG